MWEQHVTYIRKGNIWKQFSQVCLGKNNWLSPLKLLNKICKIKLESIFPWLVILLRIFVSLPMTVAFGERAFSTLKRVKNFQRSTMSQDRLNGLAILSIENDLARGIDYDDIIRDFATKKAKRVVLWCLFTCKVRKNF